MGHGQKQAVRESMRILKIATAVLTACVIGAGLAGCDRTTDSTSDGATANVFTPEHPTALQAFQARYRGADASGKYTVDAKHLASLWFSKELTDGASKLFVVFVQEQNLDETGAVESCHACTATLHAITFTKTEKGWSSANTQQNVANVGSWGKAPDIAKSDVLTLAPGNILLLLPEEDHGMGVSMKGLQLLNHFQGKWSNAGYVRVAEDNLGGECTKDSDPRDPKACYSFTGTLSIQKGQSPTHPDLLLTKKGTEFDAVASAVVPAKSEVYVYKADGYVSARQEREKAAAAKSASLTQGKQPALTVPAAEPGPSKPAKDVNRALTQCAMPAAQYGQYSSYDGGKSALKLVQDKCQQEFLDWRADCESQGDSKDSCGMKGLIAVQVVLKMFGK